MSWADGFKQALVGGLAGLAVVIVFIVVRSALSGASEADWLSFAGAMAGTGLAVGGAVWIEHWKRRTERRAEAKSILVNITRLRSIADMMLKERPQNVSEADWQSAINQMPGNLASYTSRLERALDRLTTATDDSDVMETGDLVLRAAKRVSAGFASSDGQKAPQLVASLDLLRNCCDVAMPILTSRLNFGKSLTLEEAMEGRGQPLN